MLFDQQQTEQPDMQPQIAATGQPMAAQQVIGPEQLREFTRILEKYNTGTQRTKQRAIASENWWKMRNTIEEQRESRIGADGGFTSSSGWLHNVIVAKHADAMDSFPEPNILPREAGDKEEAQRLSDIIPCVLEQNHFEETYSDVMWQKCKFGTGCYKIVWDPGKLNGLGDISVERANMLELYWEPGVTDIQKGRYFFHTELREKDLLEEEYPQLKGQLKSNSYMSPKFLYDEHKEIENMATVIDVYYHRNVNGRRVLHYVKYVGDTLLYASENTPEYAQRGYYDHGLYPYVFDVLFPIEGSPCGYGYVDICRSPQTEIDLMKTGFVKNVAVGSAPRYFARQDGGVNLEEFLDTSVPIVHVAGNIGDDALRPIEHNRLDGAYINMLDRTIQELRETSGNTETAAGSTSSGVTAASAIAALQEASGKGSRDATQGSYRNFAKIINLCIELVRQFYDMPRQFRIIGQYGAERFITYDNSRIQPQHQGNEFGEDMGYRLPVFDIKISSQKRSVYTKVAQNELALQFFQLGFFNPQMVDQALMCMDMMEFDGKEEIMQKISQMGTMAEKLQQYMQLALAMAQQVDPMMAEAIAGDVMASMGGATPSGVGSASVSITQADPIRGLRQKEHALVSNARERASNATQPDAGGAGKEAKK